MTVSTLNWISPSTARQKERPRLAAMRTGRPPGPSRDRSADANPHHESRRAESREVRARCIPRRIRGSEAAGAHAQDDGAQQEHVTDARR